jgi:hypothetical protein
MPSVSFSEAEMQILQALSQPIDQSKRAAFLEAVAAALESSGARGPGRVHEAARTAQRQFWTPPQFNEKGFSAPHPRR